MPVTLIRTNYDWDLELAGWPRVKDHDPWDSSFTEYASVPFMFGFELPTSTQRRLFDDRLKEHRLQLYPCVECLPYQLSSGKKPGLSDVLSGSWTTKQLEEMLGDQTLIVAYVSSFKKVSSRLEPLGLSVLDIIWRKKDIEHMKTEAYQE